MSNLIELIRTGAIIEAIKDDLYDHWYDENYVNLVDKFGYTALMYACVNGYTEIAKWLLEVGANVNIVDKYGNTALKIAEQYGYIDIIELLNNFKEIRND